MTNSNILRRNPPPDTIITARKNANRTTVRVRISLTSHALGLGDPASEPLEIGDERQRPPRRPSPVVEEPRIGRHDGVRRHAPRIVEVRHLPVVRVLAGLADEVRPDAPGA